MPPQPSQGLAQRLHAQLVPAGNLCGCACAVQANLHGSRVPALHGLPALRALGLLVRRWVWNLVPASGAKLPADGELRGGSGISLPCAARPKQEVSAWQALAAERRREAVVWGILGLASLTVLLLSFAWPGWL